MERTYTKNYVDSLDGQNPREFWLRQQGFDPAKTHSEEKDGQVRFYEVEPQPAQPEDTASDTSSVKPAEAPETKTETVDTAAPSAAPQQDQAAPASTPAS